MSSARDQLREEREETSYYVDSRPSSSVGVAAPEISCSPIVSPDQEGGEQEKSKEGTETERKTSTSTPLGIFYSHDKDHLSWRIYFKQTI